MEIDYVASTPVEELQVGTERVGMERISIEQLRYLIRLLDQSDTIELEVRHESAQASLVLRKARPQAVSGASAEQIAINITQQTTVEVEGEAVQEQYTIRSPFVGIFQSWYKAKDTPCVTVGDTIQEGQCVGAIRSLDIPAEVESPVSGRLVELLVQNGQPVEYGQPLMTVARE